MTDLETITAMLGKAGIEYYTSESDTTEYYGEKPGPGRPRRKRKILTKNVVVEHGYSGFSVQIVFNPDGSLREVGAWE